MTNARLLGIYLNDHLAGATAGIELARRTLAENEGTELAAFLRELLAEIEEDRDTLVQLMLSLGIARSTVKLAAAWTAEKVGRMKLNGQLRGYSPLSRLVELEGLAVGVEGKRALWLALGEVRARDHRLRDIDFDGLAERARSQRERLEFHRLAAAAEALGA
jgi:hypothetical protein